jgi:predicted protein tyrosine phosphatase
MRVVFVCSAALNRSPTAAELFNGWTDERGRVWKASSYAACNEVPEELQKLQRADVILAMEPGHVELLRHRLGRQCKIPVFCLNIPDMYLRNDPKLIRILKRKVPKF